MSGRRVGQRGADEVARACRACCGACGRCDRDRDRVGGIASRWTRGLEGRFPGRDSKDETRLRGRRPVGVAQVGPGRVGTRRRNRKRPGVRASRESRQRSRAPGNRGSLYAFFGGSRELRVRPENARAGSEWRSRRHRRGRGEVPKRSNGADCKSAGLAFGGSNPPLSTKAKHQRRAGRESGGSRRPRKTGFAGCEAIEA
jgi:hypothetical protein